MSIIWITDHLAGLFNIKSVNQNTILEKENNFLKNEIFIYPQEIALTTVLQNLLQVGLHSFLLKMAS